MNGRIYRENNFKVGADFELHTVKKKDITGKIERFLDKNGSSEGEVYACKKKQAGGSVDAQGEYLHAFQFMNIVAYLVTPLLLGVILGSYIDNLLKIRPIATLFALFLGVIAMFYNLVQLIKKTTYAGNKH